MTAWLIVTVLALAGLVVTLFALFAGGHGRVAEAREPDWLVPQPVEVRRARFPLAWRGYDAAHVDVYLDALAAAYEELYFAAGPSVVARARERLALRLGHVTSRPSDVPDRDVPGDPEVDRADGGVPERRDADRHGTDRGDADRGSG